MNKSKLVSNTQIYLDCRKLLDEILDITPNFPRAYKFSVGSKMHDIGVNLISEISAAYINRDRQTRIQHLVNFQSQFEVLKTLLRIAGERKWILGRSRHANIIELTDAYYRTDGRDRQTVYCVEELTIKNYQQWIASKCQIWKVTTNRACKLSVKMGCALSFIVKTK